MNHDMLNSVPIVDVARGSMSLIDAMQDMQPDVQIASLAAVFLLAAEHWSVKPQDAFRVATNAMNHADGRRPEFKGVAAYMESEL